jgi:hypothetical protein
MQIFVSSDGRQYGPFTPEQVNLGIQQGTLYPMGMMAWYEGLAGWIPLLEVPGVVMPTVITRPPPVPAQIHPMPAMQGDATGGVIPYKNPPALLAYYLGIFSLIPLLGFFLGIAAIILGIQGLRRRRFNPVIRGSVHAWIGIVVGTVIVLVHLFVLYVVIMH